MVALKLKTEKLKLINKAKETLEKKLKLLIKEKNLFVDINKNIEKGTQTEKLSVRYKSLMGIEIPTYEFIKEKRLPLGINTTEDIYIKREEMLEQFKIYAKYKTNKESIKILNLEIEKLMVKINALKILSKKLIIQIRTLENKIEEEEREELIIKIKAAILK